MSCTFANLIFEPDVKFIIDYNDILWKAQLDYPNNFNSIILTILKDNIEYDNRRILNDWYDLLKQNYINYSNTFDSQYCMEFMIHDSVVDFNLQLFACDIHAANYNLEIEFDDILPILSILDLNKSGSIFPLILLKKIENAEFILKVNQDVNLRDNGFIIDHLKRLKKLAEHCLEYECNIKYYITKS